MHLIIRPEVRSNARIAAGLSWAGPENHGRSARFSIKLLLERGPLLSPRRVDVWPEALGETENRFRNLVSREKSDFFEVPRATTESRIYQLTTAWNMILISLLLLSLALGALAGVLWEPEAFRGNQLQVARVPATSRRPVWRWDSVSPGPDTRGIEFLPPFGLRARWGSPPRSPTS